MHRRRPELGVILGGQKRDFPPFSTYKTRVFLPRRGCPRSRFSHFGAFRAQILEMADRSEETPQTKTDGRPKEENLSAFPLTRASTPCALGGARFRRHPNRRLIGALIGAVIGALIGVENPRRFPNRRAFARFEKYECNAPPHISLTRSQAPSRESSRILIAD